MDLHFRRIGEGKPLIILHGLFGFSDNWQTQAKKLADYYEVILVDLRNHGHSPWSDDFSYEIMAEDVVKLIQTNNWTNVQLMGHSMGGKVAMLVANAIPDAIEKLIVVDMGIKAYPPHHQHILAAINAIDLNKINVRSEAEEIMKQYVDSEGVRQFLLKNIYWKEKGKLAWRMNFPVLEAHMEDILHTIQLKECFVPALFVRGALSQYVLDEDFPSIEEKFPDSEFVTIQNAGHWVHAENPEVFLETILAFLLR